MVYNNKKWQQHKIESIWWIISYRQIHQVQLPHLHMLIPVSPKRAGLHCDGEDGVRAWTLRVHGRGPDSPVLVAHLHDPLQFVRVMNHVTRQVLDEHANVWSLFDLQALLVMALGAQQITDFLIVDFQVCYTYEKSRKVKSIENFISVNLE